MIYETAIVVGADLNEEALTKVKTDIKESFAQVKAELLAEEDWGTKRFAQPMANGTTHGRYVYFMYQTADMTLNAELERRYGINESIHKFIIVKLGTDAEKAQILKDHAALNVVEENNEDDFDDRKEKKGFSKKRTCFFASTNTKPDWKAPRSYSWLVNEFGKISAARVTGLSPKFQRMANASIKRGRCMGLISHLSNHIAQ